MNQIRCKSCGHKQDVNLMFCVECSEEMPNISDSSDEFTANKFIETNIKRINRNWLITSVVIICTVSFLGIYPLIITNETDKPNWTGFIIFIVLLLFGFWKLFKTIFFLRYPDQHPIRKNLNKYGHYYDICNSIDNEIKHKIRFGEILVTKSWIFQQKKYSLLTIFLDDIIWIYKNTTHHSVNSIPTGKTYEIKLKTKRGQEIEIKLSNETKADDLLNYLAEKIPYIAFGFTKELEEFWKGNPSEFISYIQEKRKIFKK